MLLVHLRSYGVKGCAAKECTLLASQNIPAGAAGKASAPGKREVLPSPDRAAAAFTQHTEHGEAELGRATWQTQLGTDKQPLIPNTLC